MRKRRIQPKPPTLTPATVHFFVEKPELSCVLTTRDLNPSLNEQIVTLCGRHTVAVTMVA
jgi:hypothetical protein